MSWFESSAVIGPCGALAVAARPCCSATDGASRQADMTAADSRCCHCCGWWILYYLPAVKHPSALTHSQRRLIQTSCMLLCVLIFQIDVCSFIIQISCLWWRLTQIYVCLKSFHLLSLYEHYFCSIYIFNLGFRLCSAHTTNNILLLFFKYFIYQY